MDLSTKDRTEESTRLSTLPELPYSIRDGKGSKMMFAWILIVLDLCILPLVLFYSLWYATDLGHYIRRSPRPCIIPAQVSLTSPLSFCHHYIFVRSIYGHQMFATALSISQERLNV